MGDTFKFSLYEVFGYIFPGLMLGGAILMADISILHPLASDIPAWVTSKTALALIVGVSYILGHAVQAAANVVFRGTTKRIVKSPGPSGCHELLKRARQHLPGHLDGFPDETLISIFEQAFQNRGTSPEREVFVYREGFYRGMLISMSALATSLLLLCCRAHDVLLIQKASLTRWELGIGAFAAAVMASGMHSRAVRFARYRILQAVMSWLLTLDHQTARKEEKSGSSS